jgi:hypothetical protein
LFVPVFKTILQQLPNKQTFIPLSTWVYKLPTRMDLNIFRRGKDTLWPKADTLDVHTLLTIALSVNCSGRNPLFAGSSPTLQMHVCLSVFYDDKALNTVTSPPPIQ